LSQMDVSAAKSERWFGQPRAVTFGKEPSHKMGQEISVSYQAVKSKVYRLIDSLVEDAKTQGEVQESVKRWWKLVHPADRPIARKYLLSVLAKSNATLAAISDGLTELQDFEVHQSPAEHLPRLHAIDENPWQHRMKASSM